jgi:phytoene dehydrogenase-like protein
MQDQKSMLIIGAGIAGLSMGIYGQMNGYKTKIVEMHTQPGGLMTGWKRKGYIVDGCIHWLTGSSRAYNYYRYWEEIGLIDGMEIFDPEVFSRVEFSNGRVVNLYTNIDHLEKHLLEIGPQDEKIIKETCNAIRKFSKWNPSVDSNLGENLKSIIPMASAMPILMKWGRVTMSEFGSRFSTPELRFVFGELWYPEMSCVGLIMTLAMLSNKAAGYPIGGSIPMAENTEKRYLDLGGEIQYGVRVEKILVEENSAVGIRLADGTEYRADVVVSAADGHATIFDMLDGRYVDEQITARYDSAPTFPSLLYIGLGVNNNFKDLPQMTGGLTLYLEEPITVAGEELEHIEACIYNYDPNLSPAGKTAIAIMLNGNYSYWKDLYQDRERYDSEKKQAALQMITVLNKRFPGLENQVEMIDVATPVTFERYTGNWKGSFEGWLPTPQAMMKPIPKTLPGLENFYMVGQWVQAGGGLPSGVMTARDVMKRICKKDGMRFTTKH